MKKFTKRAFTLVELIAVIIILGLLVLIAVPAVSSNVNKSQKTVYKSHEKTMENTVKGYMTDCLAKDGKECSLPSAGRTSKMRLREFVELGMIVDGLEDPSENLKYCDEEESFVYVKNIASKSNRYDLEYEVCLICSEYKSSFCTYYSDNIAGKDVCTDCPAPSCGEILAENTKWTNKNVTVGVRCVDHGASCLKASYYQTVKTSNKEIEIQITDEAGKSNSCSLRAYVDKEKPLVSIGVKNGEAGVDGWYKGAGTIQISTLSDALSGINTFGLGQSLKANYNQKEELTVGPGITTVYGYAKDNAGNESRSNPLEIKFDNLLPIIEEISLGYQVFPGREDLLNSSSSTGINFNNLISEYGMVYGVKVYFGSNPSGTTMKIFDGSNQINSMDVGSGATEIELPVVNGKIFTNLNLSFTNNMVNNITRLEVLTKSSSGFYTNKDVRVHVYAYDTLSTIRDYSFDNGVSWQSSSSKLYSSDTSNINIVVRDKAGNTTKHSSVVSITNIDKVNPSCSLTRSGTVGESSWYRSNVSIAFLSTTDAKAGVRDYSFNTTGIGTPKTKTQTADTSGTSHTGYVIDKAGNSSSCSISVKKDTVAPSCTITRTNAINGTNGWYTTNVNLQITASDSRSGVSAYGMAHGTATYDNVSTKTHSSNGASIVWNGVVRDLAGNTNACSNTFKIDKIAPSCTSSGGSATWRNTNLTITGSCTDTGGSGCASATITRTYSSNTNTTAASPGSVSDNAGNTTACPSNQTVKIDKTAPTCASSGGSAAWRNTNLTIKGTCTDTGGSGCASTTVTKAYSSNTNTTVASPGSVSDNAGNTTTCPGNQTVKIDKTAPSCASSGGSATWRNTNLTITGTCTDTGGSGCASTTVTKAYSSNTNTTVASPGSVSDNAGNTTTCPGNQTVKIDKTAPSCSWTKTKTGTTDSVNATVSCSDSGGSLVTSCPSNLTGRKSSYTGTVKDGAGNTATCTLSVSSYYLYRKCSTIRYNWSWSGCSSVITCSPSYAVPTTGASGSGWASSSQGAHTACSNNYLGTCSCFDGSQPHHTDQCPNTSTSCSAWGSYTTTSCSLGTTCQRILVYK